MRSIRGLGLCRIPADGESGGDESPGAHERIGARLPVSTPGLCRTRETLLEATVTNLSCHGCSLATQWECLKPGQSLTLRIGGHKGLSAQVRWVIGSRAGIAFDNPLCGTSFDRLIRLHSMPAEMTLYAYLQPSA